MICFLTSDVLQHRWQVSHCTQVIHTRYNLNKADYNNVTIRVQIVLHPVHLVLEGIIQSM